VSRRDTCPAVAGGTFTTRLGKRSCRNGVVAVRFTITPLGGVGRPVTKIVGAIVDYLRPRRDPERGPSIPPQEPASGDPARYYADGGEEPGRWRGDGADALRLSGQVDMDDLAKVLAGRDPDTGKRLITAQGSSGRRPRLGVGAPTRLGPDGQPLYGARDAAAVLRLPAKQVAEMVRTGVKIALAQVFGWDVPAEPGGAYLVPFVHGDGTAWITDAELRRCEDALAVGTTSEQIAAMGPPDEHIRAAEAARLLGVIPQYVRRVAKRYEDNRQEIESTLADGRRPRSNYLVAARDPKGRWMITRKELAAFVARRRQPAVRVGYDLTLTTEKSLSVLALLGGPRVCRSVLDAIEAGNDLAIDWMERHSAAARDKGDVVPVKGWTVASFRHLTSRALDPFAHHHNVIANTVEDHSGVRRALDGRGLYRDAKTASALATAEMRYQLARSLGSTWRPGRNGGWEIAGIGDEMVRAFSRRRNEIEDGLRELEEAIGRGSTLGDVGHIVLKTRPPKRHVPVDELVATWWERARALGFTPADLESCVGEPDTPPEPDKKALFTALAGPDGICRNLSIFNRGDLLAALVDLPVPMSTDDLDAEVGGADEHGLDSQEVEPPLADPQPLIVSARRLEQIANAFLSSDHVVQLTEAGDDSVPRYTTREILAVQDRIVSRYERGLDKEAAVVPANTVDAILSRHLEMDAEQRSLVRSFCSSGHRMQCAVGHPGAGKTTAMATAREAWEAAGWRVVGAAVKGEAARVLGVTACIPTETLAWYLAHPDPLTAPIDARTVLVVDEASTISDRDLDRLGWLAEQTGATLRLIGDPAQHGAVEAGGMFRVLCERHQDDTPVLTHTHRLQDPHDRAAAEHLRRGDVPAALEALQRAGHLHVVEDELHAYTDVLIRWFKAHEAGQDHPMVDRRNSVRRSLNRLAHALLQVNGEIGTEELAAGGDRHYAVGDRVIAREPSRELHPEERREAYVRNGAIGTVIALHAGEVPADDVLTVEFDHVGIIDLPRSFFDDHDRPDGHRDVGLDHAYAVTSYAVTGATHPVSTSRIDEEASRAETYVDITRGQLANHLYLTRRQDDLDGEYLPRTPPDPIEEAIADQLTRSTGELTAWEVRQQQLDRSGAHPEIALHR
jgi:conjugative relaxase-like TrwC/TraI family protein